MAGTKHTAGPWRIKDDGRIVCYPEALETGVLSSQLPDGEKGANACLIASAPDLLEALKQVMGWISSWDPNFTQDDDWPETEHHVRAALAKAEGFSHD